MRVALAHDYLNQWGGAERVLEVLAETFPEAPIYTLLYDKEKTYNKFQNRIAGTSFLDFPYARENHRTFIPLMPLAVRFLKIPEEYDLVISSSAGFAKGINYNKRAKHISYVHTPLRYAWESEEYLAEIVSNHKMRIARPVLNYLKNWDHKIAQKPDLLISNSEFIAGKVKKYYGRDSQVIYPPVDLSVFYPSASSGQVLSASSGQVLSASSGQVLSANSEKVPAKNYFLAIGRFLHYKKFDLIITAFNETGLPLRVVGAGPEEEKLKKMARGNIEFLPFQNDVSEVRKLYWGARAVIFPQVEDFGLVAAESVSCGTPVIAFNNGGAREIVSTHGGVLFPKQETRFLINAVNEFIIREKDFIPEVVAMQAQKFSKENFVQKIKEAVTRVTASP